MPEEEAREGCHHSRAHHECPSTDTPEIMPPSLDRQAPLWAGAQVAKFVDALHDGNDIDRDFCKVRFFQGGESGDWHVAAREAEWQCRCMVRGGRDSYIGGAVYSRRQCYALQELHADLDYYNVPVCPGSDRCETGA
jgi:hypothetical protein